MNQHISSKVIKLILDHEEVQQYLHPEISNRTPVIIVTNNLIPANLSIEKHGQPVILTNKVSTDPYFEITKYVNNGGSVVFNLKYDEEGITINGEANVDDNVVQLISIDVIEN